MERVCGPSEGERVGWDRRRKNAGNGHKCSISVVQASSVLWQTSVQSCLLGLVSTAGHGPLRASLALRVTPLGTFQAKGHREQQPWRSISGLHGIIYSLCSWNISRLPSSATSVQIHPVPARLTIPRGKGRL